MAATACGVRVWKATPKAFTQNGNAAKKLQNQQLKNSNGSQQPATAESVKLIK